MSYKRVVKKKGKSYGPYLYESYRDSDGCVRKRYLGKLEEHKKISVSLFFFVGFLALLLVLGVGYTTDSILNEGKISKDIFISTEILFSGVVDGITGLVVGEESPVEEPVEEVAEEVVEELVEEVAEEVVEESPVEESPVEEEPLVEESPVEESPVEETVEEDLGEVSNVNETIEEPATNETLENETSANETFENETSANETLENETLENETLENETSENETIEEPVTNETILPVLNETVNETIVPEVNISVLSVLNSSTLQYRAVVNRPVKWIKEVNVSNGENLTVELPKGADNISILTGAEVRQAKNELEDYDRVVNETDRESLSGGLLITGNVARDIRVGDGWLTRFWKWLTSFSITGNVISEEEISGEIVEGENSTMVNIGNVVSKDVEQDVAIVYYTDAPQIREENLSNGKRVVVNASDALNYTEILSYAIVNRKDIKMNDSGLKLYWYASIEDAVAEGYLEAPVLISQVLLDEGEIDNGFEEEENEVVNESAINETYDIVATPSDDVNESAIDVNESVVDVNESVVDVNESVVSEVVDGGDDENISLDGGDKEKEDKEKNEKEDKEKKEKGGEGNGDKGKGKSNGKNVLTGAVVAGEDLDENVTREDLVDDVVSGKVKIEVDYVPYDFNGDGYVDYIEWVVPHLSEQVYEIIYITKAEHLDSNRTFVADIYEDVREQDGNWSKVVSGDEYVRVTFEVPLDNTKDITLYARMANWTNGTNDSVSIEVYEKDSNLSLVSFENVSAEGWYKVYLTELNGGEDWNESLNGTYVQDVFDLKVVCLSNSSCGVEFDYIVDPSYVYTNLTAEAYSTNVVDEGTHSHLAIEDSNDVYLNFDGVGDYVPVTMNSPETNYSFGLWFKTSTVSTGFSSVRQPTLGGNYDRNFYLEGGNIYHRIWNTEIISSTGKNYADNEWHHAMVVVGPAVSGQKIYVDGVEVASGVKSYSDFNWDTSLDIGYCWTYYNGSMDEVRLYNITLMPSEITEIYNSGRTANPSLNSTGLVSWWSFDDGSGVTATDSFGSNDGTLVQNTSWSSDSNPYSSLVGYWSFDGDAENSELATAYDWSGSGNDGTMAGDAVVNSSGGRYGEGLVLDGAGDYVDVGAVSLSTSSITVSFWAKFTANPNSYDSLVGKSNSAWNDGWAFSYYSNAIRFWIGGWNTNFGYGTMLPTDRNWHHYVGIYNGTTINIYIDGVVGTPDSYSSAMGDATALYLGSAIGSADRSFPGVLDEVMIFNTSLTEAQILEIYNNQSVRFKNPGTQALKQFNMTLDSSTLNLSAVTETPADSSFEKRVGEWELSDGYNDSIDGVDYSLGDGLVGYWHFDNVSANGENSSYVFDYSGNGNNGSVVGDISDADSGISDDAVWGKRMEFDGAGDYVDMGDVLDIGEGDLSIIAWINVGTTPLSTAYIISKRFSALGDGYSLAVSTEGFIGANILDSESYASATSTSLVDDGVWHFVATTINRDENIIVYVDGENEASDSTGGEIGDLSNDQNFTIGVKSTLTNFFNGSIDEVMIFNKSLSASEIKDLYIKGRANYQYSDYQSGDSFSVDLDSTNFLPEYRFNAGNSTNPFVSPVLFANSEDEILVSTPSLYWVGSGGNWSDSANWALSSGGAGGVRVPEIGDGIVFDSNGGNAVIDSGFEGIVRDIKIESSYTGAITQNTDLNVTRNFEMYGGTWKYTAGTSASLNVAKDMYVNSTIYTQYSSLTDNFGNGTGRNFTVGGDLTVDVGGVFNGTGLGFAAGGQTSSGSGPGAGIYVSGGYSAGGAGGYGGEGGAGTSGSPGAPYGSITSPDSLGSGGAGGLSGNGGAGGSAIVILVNGVLTVDGLISEEGGAGYLRGSGGSGGTIRIISEEIKGSGNLSVIGGNFGSEYGGGGSGGRISISLTSGIDFGSVTLRAYGGNESNSGQKGAAGTIYLNDANDIYGSLTVDNNGLSTTATTLLNTTEQFDLVNISDYGKLNLGLNSILNLSNGGELILRDNNDYFVFSDGGQLLIDTSSYNLEYGTYWIRDTVQKSYLNTSILNVTNNARLIVDNNYTHLGDLNIQNGTLTHSDNSNAQTYIINLTVLGAFNVGAGGSINLDGLGFDGSTVTGQPGLGPCPGSYVGGSYQGGGGAGHGGEGGNSLGGVGSGGSTCGSITSPILLGSGGAEGHSGAGGNGGGAIRLNVTGTLTVNGNITANGGNGGSTRGGAGAGGSIWLVTNNLSGNGNITANGGSYHTQYGGGGGGGRIAVEYTTKTFSGPITAYGKPGHNNGAAGTIYLKISSNNYGDLVVDNNNLSTTATTLLHQNITDTTAGKVTIRNLGKLQLNNSQSLTVYGDWNNTGNFIANDSSTVILAGSGNTTIYSNETFYNLKVAKGGGYVFFPGWTNVTGGFYVLGSDSNLTRLRSVSDGTSWVLNASGSQGVYSADVKDSTSVGDTLFGYSSFDAGSNIGWDFLKPSVEFVSPSPSEGSTTLADVEISVVANNTGYVNSTSYIPLDSSLVSWWRFDDLNASGDVVDYMGLNNGTVVGNASQGSGYDGYGFDFDAINGSINISEINITSISFWLNLDSPNSRTILYGSSGTNTLQTHTDGRWLIYDGSNHIYSDSPEVGSWHNYLFVYEDSGYSYYSDGIYRGFVSSDLISANVMGRGNTPAGYSVNGSIDDVMIWNRSLSDDEVAALYSNMSKKYVSTFVDFDNSLVSWWRMDDLNSSGGVVDYMGRNNGTVVGNASQTDAGKIGKAFSFDGSGDYVSGGVLNIPEVSFTLSMWAYSTKTSSYYFIDHENPRFAFYTTSAQQIHFYHDEDLDMNFNPPENEWYHVVLTVNDTGYLSLYANGLLENGQDSNLDSSDLFSGNLFIGARYASSTGSYFNGSIDDLMIFNRSLSAAEVAGLYANASTKYMSSEYSLSDGSHSFTAYAQDSEGNVNSSGVLTFNVDAVAPTVTINSPLNSSNYNSSTVFFNVTSSDEGLNGSIIPNLDSSLVSWWRMDEVNTTGEGALVSDYIGSNDGVAYGNAVQSSSGRFGKGFSFDGNGDYVSSSIALTKNSSTVSLWINTDTNFTGGYGQTIFWSEATWYPSTYSKLHGDSLYVWNYDTLGGLGGDIGNRGGNNFYLGKVNLGSWNNLIYVYNSTNTTVYINGVLTGISPYNSTNNGLSSNFRLSWDYWTNPSLQIPFNGSIDDVMIFDRALSAEEVLSLYNATALEYSQTDLGEGEHSYVVYSQDTAGNVGSASSDFSVDSVYPSVEFMSSTAEDGSVLNTNSVEVNLTASDNSLGGDSTSYIPLDNSLVSWWRMDDLNSSGGVVDYMGRNNGTVVGNASQGSGYDGYGFDFDGDGDYVNVGDSGNLDNIDKLTLSGWLRLDSYTTGGIVSKRVGPGNEQSYSFFTWTSGTPANSLYIDIDGNGDRIATGFVPNLNVWYYFDVVYDGTLAAESRVKLYINGVLNKTASETSTTIPNYSSNLTIGALNAGSSYINGSIDDVMIWNRSLSASEVAELYSNMSKKYVSTFVDFDNSLVSWWRMDDLNSTGGLVDYMGRNNGSVVNGSHQVDDGAMGKAFNFTEVDQQYVRVKDNTNLDFTSPTQKFSISAWIRPVNSGVACVVCKWDASQTERQWGVALNGLNPYILISDSGAYDLGYFASSSVVEGEWSHVVYTADIGDDTYSIYINGVDVSSGPPAANIDDIPDFETDLLIGAYERSVASPYATALFDGSIDDVMIFNRSLSADEIAALYANASTKYLDVNYTDLSDGVKSFRAYVQDLAGNVNSTESRTVRVDTTAPTVTIDNPVNGSYYNWVLFNVTSSEENYNGSIVPNLDNSLVSWYRMDDYNSTHIFDYFGRNNGTIMSGNVSVNTSGRFGGSKEFNGGVGAWIDLPDDLIVNGDNFTVSIWINSRTNNTNRYAFGTSAHNRIYLGVNNDGTLKFNKGGTQVSYSEPFNVGDWYHMVLTHSYALENQLNKAYVDGVLVGTNISRDESPIGGINIGSYDDGVSEWWNGSIDDVMIFNRTLSAEEILSMYNSIRLGYNKTDLIAGNHSYTVYSQDVAGNVGSADAGSFIVDKTYPLMEYVAPTLENDSYISNDYVEAKANFTESRIGDVKFNWNGTERILFDDSVVFMMNFDNLSALGENDTRTQGVSKNNYYATCSGVACPTWNASGKFGGAFDFDGVSDYLDVPYTNSTFGIEDEFTASVWLRPGSANDWLRVSEHSGSWSAGGFQLAVYISGGFVQFQMFARNNTKEALAITDFTYPINQWYHMVGVYNGSYVKMYINGVDESVDLEGYTHNLTGNIKQNSGILRLGGGAWGGPNALYSGQMDSYIIYNRALSDEEIAQMYFSNVYKYDTDKWSVYVNQSLNSTDGLVEGDYSYSMSVSDSAGNTNSTESRTVTVDLTAPIVMINSPLNQNYEDATVSFDVDYSDDYSGSLIPNLDNSLVSWWRMDEVNTTGEGALVTDYIGRNDGVAYGNAVQGSGKMGKGFVFDGSGDYVNVGNLTKVSDGNFLTLSAWVRKTGDHPVVDLGGIVVKGVSEINTRTFDLYELNAPDVYIFSVYDGISGHSSASTTVSTEGVWNHIVAIYNGTNTLLYVNGILEDSDYYNVDIEETSTDTYIGLYSTDQPYGWNGQIDDVMIFNRSLTADEVLALYNATSIDHSNTFEDAAHSYTVYGQDVAGNVGSSSADFTVGLDPVNGYVFNDLDSDGVKDLGEEGFKDVTVRVWNDSDANGIVSAGDVPETSGMTNGSGFFNISTYCEACLIFVDGSDVSLYGYLNTTTKLVNLSSPGETGFGWEFGNASNGSVSSWTKVSNATSGFYPTTLDSGDRFGHAVTNIGDLNGDGVSDLAVGAAWDENSSGGAENGAIYILFMNSNGTVSSFNKIANGEGGFFSNYTGVYFGDSVVSMGDINEDGVNDLATMSSYGGGIVVHILYLNITGGVIDNSEITNGVGGLDVLIDTGGYNVGSLENIGDLNGDGVMDLVVGAPAEENKSGGDSAEGAAYIFFMNSSGEVESYNKISDGEGGFNPSYLELNDNFGYSVANLGDINGDGVNDLAVGAYKDEMNGALYNSSGAVYVLFMNSTGNVINHTKIADGENGFDPGIAFHDTVFGTSVVGIGDFNDDGVRDLFVGGYGIKSEGGDDYEGGAYVLYLNSSGGVESYVKIAENTSGFNETLGAYQYFAFDVANIGDLNGDGVIDLVAGLDQGADGGAVYLLYMAKDDVTAPNITSITPANMTISNESAVNFTANFTDDMGLANATLYIYDYLGNLYNSTVVQIIGAPLAYTVGIVVDLIEGTYTWFWEVFDVGGNMMSSANESSAVGGNYSLIVDLSYPFIEFVGDTPLDATSQSEDSIFVNVSADGSAGVGTNISTFVDFDNSLVSWWRMDDVSGSTVIDYMGRNNGSVVGDAHQVTNGKIGKAFSFDGNGDYVNCGKEVSDYDSDDLFTFSSWVKTNSIGGVILSKQDGAGTQYSGISLQISPTGVLRMQLIHNLSNYISVLGETNISDGSWHHVIVTYDGSSDASGISQYVDGVLENPSISVDSLTGSILNSDNFSMGSYNDGTGSFFNGSIDDVMIFNRSLSAAEVAGLYANQTSKYVANNFSGLADGAHTFRGYVQDQAGNVNFTEIRNVSTGMTPPEVTVNSPLNQEYRVSSITFNVTAIDDEEVDSCWVTIDGGVTNNSLINDSSFSEYNWTNDSIPGGQYIAQFYCNDTKGNVNGDENVTFVVLPTCFSCGDTVILNAILSCNLTCPSGNGLIIGEDNVSLDCGGNTITGANVSSTSGVYATELNNITVMNCSIHDFERQIYYYLVNEGNIVYNNATGYGFESIYSQVSNHTNLSNNYAWSESNVAIELTWSSGNEVHNNIAECEASTGLSLWTVTNSNITSNFLRGANQAFNIYSYSNNNFFRNNTAVSFGGLGTYVYRSNGNEFFSHTTNGTDGIKIKSSSNNTFINCVSINGSLYSVEYDSTTSPSSINNTFLNCSYDSESVNGVGNYLTREWYYRAFVNDSGGNPGVANISAWNVLGDLIFSEFSSSETGYTSRYSFVDYVNTAGVKTSYNNYTINATNSTYLERSHSYNLSLEENIEDVFTLIIDLIAPNVSINSPLNLSYGVQMITFNVTAIDDEEVDSCWVTIDGGVTNNSLINDGVTEFYNFTNESVSEGFYVAEFYCNDSSGNVNDSESVSFSIDMTAPNITSITPANMTISNESAVNFTANFTDDMGLANATLYIYDYLGNLYNSTVVQIIGAPLAYTVGIVVDLIEGTYTWFWEVFDVGGNMMSSANESSAVGGNYSLIVDLSYPFIEFVGDTPLDATSQSEDSIFVNVSADGSAGVGTNISTFVDFDNSLVSWWRMDDVSGSTVIDYMGRNNGMVNGDASQVTNGKMGKAFSFDGSGDYVSVNDSSSLDSNMVNLSISVWVNARDTSSLQSIVSKFVNGVTSSTSYYVQINEGTSRFYIIDNDVDAEFLVGTVMLNNYSWNHIVGTFDGSAGELTLYVNGELDNSVIDETIDNIQDTNTSLEIGAIEGGTARHFNGSIDDVMIFNRSLSAAEVAGLYANQTSKYVANNFSGLADGAHTFRGYVQDQAGNVNFTESRTVTIGSIPSAFKFIVENSAGLAVASFDDKGDAYFAGSVNQNQESLSVPTSSFIVENSSGDSVAYVDGSGNLYLLGGVSTSDDLTGLTSGNLEFRNATNDLVSFFDNQGNLKLKGSYLASYPNP